MTYWTGISASGVLVAVSLPLLIAPGAAAQSWAGAEQLPKPAVALASTLPPAAIVPMPLTERVRRGVVPKRGFVSSGVDGGTLISGDGKMMVEVQGSPLTDLVSFRHERLLQPWKMPFEAPKIAAALPEVRKLILDGRYREALELSFKASTDAGMPPGTRNHSVISPFSMRIEIPEAGRQINYLRSTDFETGEIAVRWSDTRGDWLRRTFVSRPDNVVVQYLTPPRWQTLNVAIAVNTAPGGRGGGRGSANTPAPPAGRGGPPGDASVRYERDFNERRLIVMGHFSPDTGNIGFAGVTRVVLNGGTARMENDRLVVSGAQSLMLLTRIEWYHDYSRAQWTPSPPPSRASLPITARSPQGSARSSPRL
jgi:hypothetical protein